MGKGFSLFELLVVMAIVAILSTIALPNYMSWRTRTMVDSTAFNLRADLQRAKLEAMKNLQNVYVDFSADGYSVFKTNKESRRFGEGDPVFSKRLEGVQIDMTNTSFSGGRKFSRFNPRGISSGYYGRVTISSGQIRRKVVVDMVGRVKIEYI